MKLEMPSGPESTPIPRPHHLASFPARHTGHVVSPSQETFTAQSPTSLSGAPRADLQRMDTIEEQPSGDSSHQDEEMQEESFPLSGTAARSFEDLTAQGTPPRGDKKRLKRQARIESKETEC